ncbi:MAG: hypothetical protein ACREH4_02125, partial [Vitreimonas sp.]
MPAFAIATPILRATSRAPWRTILFATASVVALSVSPPASAQCVLAPGSASCPVDPANYPNGIDINGAGVFTLTIEDGVIVTPTDNGPGVTATSGGAMVVGAENVAITTTGPVAHGMSVTSGALGSTVDLGGSIDATGAGAAGLIVNSTGAIDVSTAADISGGSGLLGRGVVIGGNNTSATLANSGIIGAASDRAIVATSAGELTITNSGDITGYVDLAGSAPDPEIAAVTFDNSGTLELRNLTEVDGVLTEAVAVSDFGGDGMFNNLAGGTLT